MLVATRSFRDPHDGLMVLAGKTYVSERSDVARSHPECFKPSTWRAALAGRSHVNNGEVISLKEAKMKDRVNELAAQILRDAGRGSSGTRCQDAARGAAAAIQKQWRRDRSWRRFLCPKRARLVELASASRAGRSPTSPTTGAVFTAELDAHRTRTGKLEVEIDAYALEEQEEPVCAG